MEIIYIPDKYEQKRKRVAAYCRVSTLMDSQEESLHAQIDYYESYISGNPEWEYAGIYSDEKSAAKTANRPGFQQMLQDASHGNLDIVLVKSISRFSRNVVDCQKYMELLTRYGVELHFEKEHINTADSSGNMLLSLLSVIAQDESRSISENVKWSYRERFKRGEYNLGNHRILGYDTADRRLVPNEDVWIVKLIYQLFLEGKTYRQIARHVQKAGGKRLRSDRPMSNSTILRILQNETYVGDKLLQKQAPVNFLTKQPEKRSAYESNYLMNDHEAIIDRETWEKVQEILGERKRKREKRKEWQKESAVSFDTDTETR